MAKVKVKTAAVFNGQPVGSTIEMDEATANKYEAMKYLEIVGEVTKPKPKASPKKTAPKKTESKTKEKPKVK